MNDEILWEVDHPPPKDWYARHKAGEALGDPEAAKRSAVDDIEDNEFSGELLLDYQQGVAESENIGTGPPNAHGINTTLHDVQKDHTGNLLIDPSIIPDYSSAYGIS